MLKKDSRKIVCGDTYVDTSGNNEYVFDAVKNGAVEVISKQKYDDKTIVVEGPLKALQEHIVSVNKREHFAILNIEFLNRRIKAGIEMQDKEI